MKERKGKQSRPSAGVADSEIAVQMQLRELSRAEALAGDEPKTSADWKDATWIASSSRGDGSTSEDQRDAELAVDDAELSGDFLQSSSSDRKQKQIVLDEGTHQFSKRRKVGKESAKSVVVQGSWLENPSAKASASTDSGDSIDIHIYHLFFAIVRRKSGNIGIAWGITDKAGDSAPLFEHSSHFGRGFSRTEARFQALIEGLKYAFSVGMRDIVAYGSSAVVSNYPANQAFERKVDQRDAVLKCINQIKLLEEKLNSFEIMVAPKNAYFVSLKESARRASKSSFENHASDWKARDEEECPTCFESMPTENLIILQNCAHKVCCDCLNTHIEVQTKTGQVPVRCPGGCAEYMDLDECRPYLSAEVFELFEKRLVEASIPEAERIYCPFPDCSALMLKDSVTMSMVGSSSQNSVFSSRECMECNRLFCLECHVPWHANVSCADFQIENVGEEDAKLLKLAKRKKWQRCKRCKNLIDLRAGCNHMTCRCGFQFCYLCGAEWRKRKETCKCEYWDERNIFYDDRRRRRR